MFLRIQLLDTASPYEGRPNISDLRLPGAPQQGELLVLDSPEGERIITVRNVLWTINDEHYDLQVRAW